jgi:voltage-gated potassium channel
MDARSSPEEIERRHPATRLLGTVPGVRWLVAAIVCVSLAAAILARLVAPDDFRTFPDSLWWAVQTVTTVGYGDIVPESHAGRAIAALLMATGVASLSLVTAVISASFVGRIQARRRTDPVLEALDRIERRLDALERRLAP